VPGVIEVKPAAFTTWRWTPAARSAPFPREKGEALSTVLDSHLLALGYSGPASGEELDEMQEVGG
jgi:hypothetical protein